MPRNHTIAPDKSATFGKPFTASWFDICAADLAVPNQTLSAKRCTNLATRLSLTEFVYALALREHNYARLRSEG
jgi:hypothetical protein